MVGLTNEHIYLRYHRARYPEDEGRFMVFHRDDDAYWFDDLVPADAEDKHPVREWGHQNVRAMGPE
jgi:lysine 2,3-aminomutase